uniref:Methyltransferase type 11 domain-containing protein n=1 Tax=viral metagenome TaxID=1070528 RepID=A0A6C0AZP9_9ZZZZ|tara:strand:+ start:9410 stop:10051 length:642 start_codon:yes stop_codon:yes gene_type:complete
MNSEIFSSIFEKKNVKEIYEIIAPHFNVTRIYTWSWVDSFINNLPKGSFIYDIGCGNGRNMHFEQHTFIGIDNCEKFISMCREKNLLVQLANMTKINLPDSSADAIICIAVFHHLSTYENRIKALLEMKRLIKPKTGKILLSVWSINQPLKTRITFNNYGHHMVNWNKKYKRYYYIFQINEIISLFEKVGLKILKHKYDCGNEIFILYIEKKN